jgi:hypothetical protein
VLVFETCLYTVDRLCGPHAHPPSPSPRLFDSLPRPLATGAYFFLADALCLVTSLMTPTATVWRMSRTAKRPSGG